jgi:hypothetical protein
MALTAESSPTPNVVTMAETPLTLAYPSAAYPVVGLSTHYCSEGSRFHPTSIQLVTVSDPLQADFGNVVESDQIVVSRNTVD